ncbi:MAG: hydroxyacylglutathione hydrolase [Gammaproteobacteria bacterium]|nr:hydroxyacylglutathione hydrolase [Gammaproteobacteria bacterium]
MLTINAIPAFEDNYIWALTIEGGELAAVVDPGDADPVIEYLDKHGLKLGAILITHHHGDHTGGIRELLHHYGELPVYGPAGERIPALTHALKEDDTVTLEDLHASFRVIDAPGHTRGHILYHGEGLLFCGDTLFAGGCGRLFEGTPEQMYNSLSKIEALPDSTLVYCAHEYTEANLGFAEIAEPDNQALHQRIAETRRLRAQGEATVPSLLALEKATNPFLRSHQPELIEAAEGFAGHSLNSPAEVFATVRHWKDSLD